jgi:hypothetical protein
MSATPQPARSYEAFRGIQPEALLYMELPARGLRMGSPLAVNGLVMPLDFPTVDFEFVYERVSRRASARPQPYEHFNSAWNAVSLRFTSMCDDGDAFTASITAADAGSSHQRRYLQERYLFGLFCNGFSAFEAFFYGLFAIGALLQTANFAIARPEDQRKVSVPTAIEAYSRAFPGDPILAALKAFQGDIAYTNGKEIRNVLAHRTAPGRVIFASVSSDIPLPPTWKLKDIPLDAKTTAKVRGDTARMLATLMRAAAAFIEARVH